MNRRWQKDGAGRYETLESYETFLSKLPQLETESRLGVCDVADVYAVYSVLHSKGRSPQVSANTKEGFYYLLAEVAQPTSAENGAPFPPEMVDQLSRLEPVVPVSSKHTGLATEVLSLLFKLCGGEDVTHILLAIVDDDGSVSLMRMFSYIQPPFEGPETLPPIMTGPPGDDDRRIRALEGLHVPITQSDLESFPAGENLKAACVFLSQSVLESPACCTPELKPTLEVLRDAPTGQDIDFDEALQSVAAIIQESAVSSRLLAMELLVAQVQTAFILAATQKQSSMSSTTPPAPAAGKQSDAATVSSTTPSAPAARKQSDAAIASRAGRAVSLLSQQAEKLSRGILGGADEPAEPDEPLILKGPVTESKLLTASKNIAAVMVRLPPGTFDPIMPQGSLDEEQMSLLKEVNSALAADYKTRRRMIIERAKMTLKSFTWSERLEKDGTRKEVETLVEVMCANMNIDPQMKVEEAFILSYASLGAPLQRIVQFSSTFASSMKSVLIGPVPDSSLVLFLLLVPIVDLSRGPGSPVLKDKLNLFLSFRRLSDFSPAVCG
eukprot:gene16051-22188_t